MAENDRFRGLTSGGPLPGEEQGRWLRSMWTVYGDGTPPVVESDTSRRGKKKKKNKPPKQPRNTNFSPRR